VTTTGGFVSRAGTGYWLAFANGSVVSRGAAQNYGSASGLPLNAPVLSGAATPSAHGYWLVASDGGIFGYGDAHFYGSMGGHRLNAAIFSLAPTRSGRGYWLVAFDGGVFAFGDAHFYGSAGGLRLRAPVIAIAATPSGHGYHLLTTEGSVYSYGDARYYGSLHSRGVIANDVVGIAPTPSNRGYWLVRSNGDVYPFGDAPSFGSYAPAPCDRVVAVITNPAGIGYRLVTKTAATVPYGNAPAGRNIDGTQGWCNAQHTCGARLTTAADYQSILNPGGPQWVKADGLFRIDLGDDRHLWLFGDTFWGQAGPDHILRNWRLPRNSLAIERGNCLEYRFGSSSGQPYDYIPGILPDWYWPTGAVADAGAGVVHVALTHVRHRPGYPRYDFEQLEQRVATLDIKSLVWRRTDIMPAPAGLKWGLGMAKQGAFIYLYAISGNGRQFVARTTPGHLADGRWQFFTGTGYSNSVSALRPMHFQAFSGAPASGPVPPITVAPYGNGFLASAMRCDNFCADTIAWYAPSPGGPWREVNRNHGIVATRFYLSNHVAYGGHLIHSPGGWIAIWNQAWVIPPSIIDLTFVGPRATPAHDLPPPSAFSTPTAHLLTPTAHAHTPQTLGGH
jgi:hypothetical protein